MAFKKKTYWFLSDVDGSNVLMSEVRHWKREARLGTRRASKLGRGHKDSHGFVAGKDDGESRR